MLKSSPTVIGLFFLLGVIPALAGLFAFLFLLFVPAWQVFFAVSNPWLMASLLLLLLPILGAVNLPVPFYTGRNQLGLNFLAVLMPWVIAIVGAFSIKPKAFLIFFAPFLCSVLIYHAGYRFHRRGILVSSWWINLSVLSTIFLLQIFLGSKIRMVMWWGFVIQYFSVLAVTLFETLRHRKGFFAYDLLLIIGSGGQRNALWAAPAAAVLFTYLINRFWWGIPVFY
jgi:hypothetical protein